MFKRSFEGDYRRKQNISLGNTASKSKQDLLKEAEAERLKRRIERQRQEAATTVQRVQRGRIERKAVRKMLLDELKNCLDWKRQIMIANHLSIPHDIKIEEEEEKFSIVKHYCLNENNAGLLRILKSRRFFRYVLHNFKLNSMSVELYVKIRESAELDEPFIQCKGELKEKEVKLLGICNVLRYAPRKEYLKGLEIDEPVAEIIADKMSHVLLHNLMKSTILRVMKALRDEEKQIEFARRLIESSQEAWLFALLIFECDLIRISSKHSDLELFCRLLSYALLIISDEELHEGSKLGISIEFLVEFIKKSVQKAVQKSVQSPLSSYMVKVLNQLNARDARRPFSSESSIWVSCTLPLTRVKLEDFLAEEETPVISILKETPFMIPFSARLELLYRLVGYDKDSYPRSHWINVRKTSVFADAYAQLSNASFEGPIKVVFMNELTGEAEHGIDGGGLFKQFINE